MTKKSGLCVCEGAVVAIQPKGTPRKPSRVCLCRRADADGHAHRHDCSMVAIDTPVGEALLGRKVGDTVTVMAPGGHYKVKITEIVLDKPVANAA